jgi:hypothetical protein
LSSITINLANAWGALGGDKNILGIGEYLHCDYELSDMQRFNGMA